MAGTRSAAESSAAHEEMHALRENFTLAEFKSALLGSWESVFTYENRGNTLSAEFTRNECRLIIGDRFSDAHIFVGPYTVELERPYNDGSVTFARITVQSNRGQIVLGRVNFGDHNGVMKQQEPFLRIDMDPYGVLKLRSR
jgi:hypothetical protein